MKELFKVMRYLKPYISSIILAFIFMTLQVITGFLIPMLSATIIDEGIYFNSSIVVEYGIYMIIVAVFGLLFGLINNYFSMKIATNATAELRSAIFKKITTMSFQNIDQIRTSKLITTATNDVTRLQQFYQMLLRIVVRAPLMVGVGIAFALQTSLQLSQIFIFSVPILLITFVVILIIVSPMYERTQKSTDAINKVVIENANAPRVVKSFNLQESENKKFKENNEAFEKVNKAAERVMGVAEPIIIGLFNVTLAGILLLGSHYMELGYLVEEGIPQIGVLTAFNNYAMQILFGLLMFAMMSVFMARAIVSARRINQVLDAEVYIKNIDNALTNKEIKGKITFKDVAFSYSSSDHNVINNINLEIKPGERIGIIGSTGSGKTSLINLIPRLYDVTNGAVLIDDINVKEYHTNTLRGSIALVTQKATLFSGSIGTNIRLGNKSASYSEFDEAAKASASTEFIYNYDDLFNHEVEQEGANLSGGQKQRISLARAFIKKPSILILDDSTSALDAKSEQQVKQSIDQLSKNMTTLIIAQKVSTVKDLDKIIVLSNNGYLDGFNTHEKLLKTSKVYKEIVQSQIGHGGNQHE